MCFFSKQPFKIENCQVGDHICLYLCRNIWNLFCGHRSNVQALCTSRLFKYTKMFSQSIWRKSICQPAAPYHNIFFPLWLTRSVKACLHMLCWKLYDISFVKIGQHIKHRCVKCWNGSFDMSAFFKTWPISISLAFWQAFACQWWTLNICLSSVVYTVLCSTFQHWIKCRV